MVHPAQAPVLVRVHLLAHLRVVVNPARARLLCTVLVVFSQFAFATFIFAVRYDIPTHSNKLLNAALYCTTTTRLNLTLASSKVP
jgi:hypothetical protein